MKMERNHDGRHVSRNLGGIPMVASDMGARGIEPLTSTM